MSVNATSLSSFNANHELYDRARPSFQQDAVQWLIETAGLHHGSKVVELAVGTGKFTKSIVDKGYELVAVEPSEGMLTSFKRNFPNIEAKIGSSYDTGIDSGWADAVIIAQAYHWFADHKSLEELSRILKPGGKLVFIWNIEVLDNLSESHWQKTTTEKVWSYDVNVPQYRHNKWQQSFENQSWFKTPYQEKILPYQLSYSDDDMWSYWDSRSYITALDEQERQKVRKFVEEEVAKAPKEERDSDGKLVAERGTHVVVATKC
ncbi:putative methyltransferase [Yarrowia sp. E02]|nr:putative methyltransferase [Yarrowia sp. E02]